MECCDLVSLWPVVPRRSDWSEPSAHAQSAARGRVTVQGAQAVDPHHAEVCGMPSQPGYKRPWPDITFMPLPGPQ